MVSNPTTPLILTTPNFTIERNRMGEYRLTRHYDGARTCLYGEAADKFYNDVCRRSMVTLEACVASYTGAMQ